MTIWDWGSRIIIWYMKDIKKYIFESSATGNLVALKERIVKMIDSADTDDLLSVIKILDKTSNGTVYQWLTKVKGVPEKFAERIMDADRRGELIDLVSNMDANGNVSSLPTFDQYLNGTSIYDLFSTVMSKRLVSSIYDIEGTSGTGVIGKGEILLNVFVQNFGTDFKGKRGDVHIVDNTGKSHEIEIKTTPHGHPGDRDTKTFALVIDGLENKFGIDRGTANKFFKTSDGKTIIPKLIDDYMESMGGSQNNKMESVTKDILYCLLLQFGRQDECNSIYKQSKLGKDTLFDGKRIDIQRIIDLAGAVQMKCYVDAHPEMEYVCVIDSSSLEYKMIPTELLKDIGYTLSSGIKFTNSMKLDYAAGGQTSTMKINGFRK